MSKDLRGTWKQALLTFFLPIILVFTVRWLIIEPYAIPSGSMIPSLLVHDHIVANKLAYGIHFPFSKKWLVQWSEPKRGDVIIFRYPQSPEVFYVKRAVALAGDEIEIKAGQIWLNGQPLELQEATVDNPESGFTYFQESGRTVRYMDKENSFYGPFKVPEGHVFALGDNRDQSNDSRFWGTIPMENVIGSAVRIWLSCEETLASANFLCDPKTIRWNRLLIPIH